MQIPVAIRTAHGDFPMITVSKEFPRYRLVATSNWAESVLLGSFPYVKSELVLQLPSAFAVRRVLDWLCTVDLKSDFATAAQIRIFETDDFKSLVNLYGAVLYFNLKGSLCNQVILRRRIIAAAGQPNATMQDISLIWTRLCDDSDLVYECLIKYHDVVDDQEARTNDDIWSPILAYFSRYEGLRDVMNELWWEKQDRLKEEEEARHAACREARLEKNRRRDAKKARKIAAQRNQDPTSVG